MYLPLSIYDFLIYFSCFCGAKVKKTISSSCCPRSYQQKYMWTYIHIHKNIVEKTLDNTQSQCNRDFKPSQSSGLRLGLVTFRFRYFER